MAVAGQAGGSLTEFVSFHSGEPPMERPAVAVYARPAHGAQGI